MYMFIRSHVNFSLWFTDKFYCSFFFRQIVLKTMCTTVWMIIFWITMKYTQNVYHRFHQVQSIDVNEWFACSLCRMKYSMIFPLLKLEHSKPSKHPNYTTPDSLQLFKLSKKVNIIPYNVDIISMRNITKRNET